MRVPALPGHVGRRSSLKWVAIALSLVLLATYLFHLPGETADLRSAGWVSGRDATALAHVTADPGLLTVESTVPVGKYPLAVTYDAQSSSLDVVNYGSANVSIVRGDAVVTTIPVGANPVAATYDPANGYVYVSDSNASQVTVLNGSSLLATVPTGGGPWASALDPATDELYVPDSVSANVSVIRGTTVVGSITLPGAISPRFAAYDPADGDVYVLDYNNGSVYVINGTSVLAQLHVGGQPDGEIYDPGNGLLYVTDLQPGNVSILSGDQVVDRVPISGNAYPPVFDAGNGFVYVPYEQFSSGERHWNATAEILNGTTVVSILRWGPGYTASAIEGPYANGTGYVFATSSNGDDTAHLGAIGGDELAGTVNLSGLPEAEAYDPATGVVYVTTIAPPGGQGQLNLVACSVCEGVVLNETGASPGARWSVVASNASSLFSEAGSAIAPSRITLHLIEGTYSLRVEGPAGVSILSVSSDAAYSPTEGLLKVERVTVTPPGGGGGGPGLAFLPLPAVAVLATGGSLAIAVVAVFLRRRLRRDGEALAEQVRQAIAEGEDGHDRAR